VRSHRGAIGRAAESRSHESHTNRWPGVATRRRRRARRGVDRRRVTRRHRGELRRRLRALAAGDYRGWRGVPAACTIADADRALGAAGPPQTGFPGGSPTRYRTYPPSAGAPAGLQVYDVDGAVTLIIARDAVPADTLDAMLGAPEAKQASRMPGFKTMWIWASRGLTLHRDDSSGAVAWLYAYPPMTVDAFRASWLAKVEIHRTRVR
jgi:hypothetical protein